MGIEIAEIQGRYENSQNGDGSTNYGRSLLHVKRFWGGTANGAMVQLTLNGDGLSYIQLNKEQAKELIEALMEYLYD